MIREVILAILLVQSVVAIGIGPAKTNILFEPNLDRNYTVNIYDAQFNDLILSVEGQLSQYITLEKQNIIPDEQKTTIVFQVDFPRNIPPGDYSGDLVIRSNPNPDQGISAGLQIKHDISLHVPQHGKYIKVNREFNNNIDYTITNIGLKTIEELEFLHQLDDKESKATYTSFQADESFKKTIIVPKGDYWDNLTITFDNQTKEFQNKIRVGEPSVEILEIVREFEEDEDIGLIVMTLATDWNKPITGYVNITTNNQTFTSQTIDLLESRELEVFVENPGDLIKVRLVFDTYDQIQSFNFKDVKEDFDTGLFFATLILIYFIIRSVVMLD